MSMRIVKLKAQNVMGLTAVEITPEGHVVEIVGDNGAGKSSILNCIAYAFGGRAAFPKELLRRGAESGEMSVTIDGDAPAGKPPLTLTVKLADKGRSRLTLTDVEGSRLDSPQAVLSAMWNRVAFDPEVFSRQTPKEQLESLKAIAGLDFTELDAERQRLYEERTGVNRDANRVQAQFEGTTTYDDAPTEEVSVSDLVGQLREAEAANRRTDDKRNALQVRMRAHTGIIATAEERHRDVLRLVEELAEAEARQAEAEKQEMEDAKQVDGMRRVVHGMADIDTSPLQEQISTAEETNRHVRANAEAKKLNSEYLALADTGNKLTRGIDAIDTDKAEEVAAATFPVDGLSIDDSGVTLDGIPFEQASSGESMRTSAAIAFAMNPTLPVVLIRQGSLLDDKMRAEVVRLAEEHDGQVWIELVGPGGENSVVIEDGHVRENAATEPASDTPC